MKGIYTLLIILILMPFSTLKASDPPRPHDHIPSDHITFIVDGMRPQTGKQQELRNSKAWLDFLKDNPNWLALFDELSDMPARGFGSPYLVKKSSNGGDGKKKEGAIREFIRNKFGGFGVEEENLVTTRTTQSGKYIHYDFKQYYQGLEVLNSRVHMRTDLQDRLVMFGMDYFPDINLDVQPAFGSGQVRQKLGPYFKMGIAETLLTPELKVIAVPGMTRYGYRLVYEITVLTPSLNPEESKYYVLLDAHNGKILYKQSRVHGFAPTGADITIKGSAIVTNPYDTAHNVVMPHTRVRVGTDIYYTDAEGKLSLNISEPTSAIIYLDGRWSKVVTGNTSNQSPYLQVTLQPGQSEISLDSANYATLRHTSAYYHVNKIHDYIVQRLPGFTGMDFRLDTRVERTDGSCNAFYNGTSINFYRNGNGCNSLALVPDVVYHEYGHGINYEFYDFMGDQFENGALGEAYADIWAMAITKNPRVGFGIGVTDTFRMIRRYDANPKVYPQHLVGEVHADGEIIAGAWWDLGVKLGSVDSMMDIFTEAFYALPNSFTGDEGRLYRDILIDALFADDDDADITNGTPNYTHILEAFAAHGITMLTGAEIVFTPVEDAPADQPINLVASVNTAFPSYTGDLVLYYKADTAKQWDSQALRDSTGLTGYDFTLPAFAKGTIIDYYFELKDKQGSVSAATPIGVGQPDPNLPYKMPVGYKLVLEEDLDGDVVNWTIGAPDDNAGTGIWEIGTPFPTFISLSNPSPSGMLQTDRDHTGKSANQCAVTGNANTTNVGADDVDDGKTTLFSPVFDLTGYAKPMISYWRWFTNDRGANPGREYWRVYITGDGANWKLMELTRTSDKSWRQNAIRVDDFVTQRDKVQVKFVASDYGGSLVEAGVDDLFIYDEAVNTGVKTAKRLSLNAYPNPATNSVTVSGFSTTSNVRVQVVDITGRQIHVPAQKADNGLVLNISALAAGIYQVLLTTDGQSYAARIVVAH